MLLSMPDNSAFAYPFTRMVRKLLGVRQIRKMKMTEVAIFIFHLHQLFPTSLIEIHFRPSWLVGVDP